MGERKNGRARGRHARDVSSRVSFSRAHFFLCPLLSNACYAGYSHTLIFPPSRPDYPSCRYNLIPRVLSYDKRKPELIHSLNGIRTPNSAIPVLAVGLLAALIKTLQQDCRVQDSNPGFSLNSFRLSFCNWISCFFNCEDLLFIYFITLRLKYMKFILFIF